MSKSYIGSSYIPKEEIFHHHIERDNKIKTSFHHALLAGFESFEAAEVNSGMYNTMEALKSADECVLKQ